MGKRLSGLNLDALHGFVASMKYGNFAQAALRLSRSISAVNIQLRELGSQCGTVLVAKRGRYLVLAAGDGRLMNYARRLLALNDETLYTLQDERFTGEIHLGIQGDFDESLMPGILGQFRRHHLQVRVVTRIDRNDPLRQVLAEEVLDPALLWQTEDQGPRMDRCPLAWVTHPGLDIGALLAFGELPPLMMFDSPCLMRSRAITCLDAAGIPRQMVFVGRNLNGIRAAVQVGLGLMMRTRTGMPNNLCTIAGLLPSPSNLAINLQ